MVRIGVIGGTNVEVPLSDARDLDVETRHGLVTATLGSLPGVAGREIVFVRRHGPGHERLSSSVAHKAIVGGLADVGVAAIIGTTVCGILDTAIGLGRPVIFDDLFFPDNRLPDGTACTFFDEPGEPGRGHYIFASPFSTSLRSAAIAAADAAGLGAAAAGTYAYVLGPRFNSRAEIAWLRGVGATAVSQTAGPEAVLAGELEIPYCLVGFRVDYANGIAAEPTPIEVLDANITRAGTAFAAIVRGVVSTWEPTRGEGLVYRVG